MARNDRRGTFIIVRIDTLKKGNMAKYLKIQEIIDALYDQGGVITAAAKQLNCSRQAIYQRMKDSDRIKHAHEDASRATTDNVYGMLLKNCRKGKETSIIYYLNHKGEDLGFGKPTKIAFTDPTGTKEYAADARIAILGKLLPELTEKG